MPSLLTKIINGLKSFFKEKEEEDIEKELKAIEPKV